MNKFVKGMEMSAGGLFEVWWMGKGSAAGLFGNGGREQRDQEILLCKY